MKVCVVGCGIMGAGIVFLLNKFPFISELVLIDKNLAVSGKLTERLSLQKNSGNTLITAASLDDVKVITGADFIFEAIEENFSAKIIFFKAIEPFISENTIISTNTSSLSINSMASVLKNPENFIGVHFFNPIKRTKMVEIIKGLQTSSQTVKKIIEFVKNINKDYVLLEDNPGFIVNRLLIPMINEAVGILSESVASRDDIDKAMMLGANMPMGPLALADLIGNDICLAILESIHKETGNSRYKAHPHLKKIVQAGFLGRKTGRGFYEYRKVNS